MKDLQGRWDLPGPRIKLLAGRFFTVWATKDSLINNNLTNLNILIFNSHKQKREIITYLLIKILKLKSKFKNIQRKFP